MLFNLMPLVDKEIEKLVTEGILEKVNTSSWATPVVPVLKKNNTVRLCGDFSVTLNKHLVVDEHPLPTIDELFSTLAKGEKFSKIDLKQAYLQMEIHPSDREMLTLNTHRGLYKSTRLLEKKAGKEVPFVWSPTCETAFIAAKKAFTNNEILAHYDPKLPLIVACDVSSYGVGAVLSQKYPEGNERVIQYASQSLSHTQRKYAQIDKEAYAIIFVIKKCHQYLYGSFKYDIKYKDTKSHANADALSRLPMKPEDTYTRDVVDDYEINTIELLPITFKDLIRPLGCTNRRQARRLPSQQLRRHHPDAAKQRQQRAQAVTAGRKREASEPIEMNGM
ncbi:uncharacterized protein [Temnothorax longispinosus]|uniref:uncharacterized protein n=1 Tax=Temnothorax longispinosus TaxID=300112 RepID=UPI003A9912C7